MIVKHWRDTVEQAREEWGDLRVHQSPRMFRLLLAAEELTKRREQGLIVIQEAEL